MDSQYRLELSVAIGAVQAAAQIARTVQAAHLSSSSQQQTGSSSNDTHIKEDLSPVTVADFAIQAVLTAKLRAAFASDGVVGEESAAALRGHSNGAALLAVVVDVIARCTADSDVTLSGEAVCELIDCGVADSDTVPGGADAGRVWVFDPIDGTRAFLRGEQYAINVALVEGGRQVLSVVGCPLLSADLAAPATVADGHVDASGRGCLLFAVRGFGAYARPLICGQGQEEKETRQLARHADGVSVDGLRSVTCWKHLDSGVDEAHEAVAQRLGLAFPGCDLLGWVPRWAVLALGLANVTVWVYKTRSRHGKIWDHAGAMLLFEEVGGLITDVDGRDIDLTKGRKLTANFGFVAAPRSVHHIVLKAVRDTLRAQGKQKLLQQ
ncbi:hypothetical protein B0T26DRAFT_641797 [Lasiosphaeria miniovina]|uniref:3'(2'),5'-bisphosphate nucleotidase n=1 Tax=Lasiosphaeria miniovina TaxID=1954250 RepID=A0AA40E0E4_9PEZI|nr:uncharacterized protein B0T26DRAFT_641797 [Lasiosphaeria miniovina]KAK0723319.1 hypothetical protein B0T26DRAFT_641797 [Lasiosphaeria miniovina]